MIQNYAGSATCHRCSSTHVLRAHGATYSLDRLILDQVTFCSDERILSTWDVDLAYRQHITFRPRAGGKSFRHGQPAVLGIQPKELLEQWAAAAASARSETYACAFPPRQRTAVTLELNYRVDLTRTTIVSHGTSMDHRNQCSHCQITQVNRCTQDGKDYALSPARGGGKAVKM